MQENIKKKIFTIIEKQTNLKISSVDPDKAQAEFKDGVLTLSLPMLEEAKSKRIAVKAAN